MNAPNARAAEILDAYLQALEAGRAPDRHALLAEHPDLAEWLRAALEGLDFIHGAGRDLATGDEHAAPGQALGDYRILREVGRGGMAVVYEAEQISLGRRVALKVLPFAAVLDPKQLQRFKNEALAAAHLRHPNIVPVHAVGCERGVHYYAMQFVEGQSLAAAIRDLKGGGAGEGARTPISSHGSHRERAYIRMAAALGKQAAEALDHAHELGIVHRDVKPGNLLVDEGGTLWVTDFGLARSVRDVGLTMTGELLGTVRYMSPEQALAKRVPVDHRTDVYSLGATLYELFTLEPAFPGDDPHLVIQDVAFREPVPPRRLNAAIPLDLETVLLKAMSKDPAGRYATAQEMAEDLTRYLEDKPVLARRPSLATRVAKWSRRHRVGVAAFLAILLVGAAALVIGTKREEKNTRAALERAEDARRRADAALKKVELSLGVAYESVRDFLAFAGIHRLDLQPTLTPELRALLGKALELYDVYVVVRGDARTHTDRSLVLTALGRFDEALVAADRAIEIDPSLHHAHVARCTALRRLGRFEEALGTIDRAIGAHPNDPDAHVERGINLMGLGRMEEALKCWDRAIEIEPNLVSAHNNRGLYFLERGLYADALECFDRAIKAAPTCAFAYTNRSTALAYLGRLREALEVIDLAIALSPEEAWPHLHRGAILERMGRLDEALAETDRAVAIDAKLGRAHYNRGTVLGHLGRRDEALAALELAVGLEPTYAPAHCNLGIHLAGAGRRDEALESLDRAIALEPSRAAFHGARASVLQALGRDEEALAEYDRVIAIDAKDPVALNAAAWGRATSADPHARDAKRAVELARRAVDLMPSDGGTWNTLGVALCRAEAWAEALGAFEKSIALRDGGDARDWFFVAIAQKALGRDEQAREWYRKAVAWTEAHAAFDAELKRFRAEAAAALGAN